MLAPAAVSQEACPCCDVTRGLPLLCVTRGLPLLCVTRGLPLLCVTRGLPLLCACRGLQADGVWGAAPDSSSSAPFWDIVSADLDSQWVGACLPAVCVCVYTPFV